MINFSLILDAIKDIFDENLSGYTITRNERRNDDPNVAATNKGWIGIYRGSMLYDAVRIGNNPYDVAIEPKIEIQCASARSGKDAEDRLQDAEYEILTLLKDNKKLNNTVSMTNGYEIEYQYNDTPSDMYHLAAIITLKSKAET